MALLAFDSFDHLASADLGQKWSVVPSAGTPALGAYGRKSTNGVHIGASPNAQNSGYFQRTFTPSGNIAIVGIGSRWVSGVNGAYQQAGSESPCIMAFRLNGATQIWLSLNIGSGLLEVYRGATLIQACTAGMAIGQYPFIEMMANVATGTAGSVAVRINNTLVLDVPGINTANTGTAGWNQVKFGQMASGGGSSGQQMHLDFDDFYVCDGAGPAPWNTFLGDCSAVADPPTAEGDLSEWTPAAGADNSLMVKEALADGDATYVKTITPGATDTFLKADVAAGAVILGVQINVQLRKEDAGACVVQAVARKGGVSRFTAIPNPGTTYGIGTGLFVVDPETGLPWTPAGWNATQPGYTRG